ncbi:MAG: thioredoxin domain-containing protein, partial [Paracoccaceae bacterium]|nr:thioredoxin domain-containing protein [Paracoccaceae bacterium]
MAFKRTLLALGAALIAGGLWMAAPQRAMAADTAAASATQDLPAIPDMSIGNPDAKVHVIEYLSFTCPHCEEFHATVWPKIKKNYIDNGKIRFTIREVY